LSDPSGSLDPVLGLMKFGAVEYLQELLTQGHLFMQPVSYFRALEADSARGDSDEALTYCYQPSRTVLEVRGPGGDWQNVGGMVGPMLYREDRGSTGNAFCMFALRASHAEALARQLAETVVDQRNQAFGDCAVVFTDGDELLLRARAAAAKDGLTLRQGLVEYVDKETYHGPMGPFRKFSAFSYQSEFRLVAKPGCVGPRSLMLGSLEDIAVRIPLAEINRMLRLRSDDGSEFFPR